MTSIQENRFIFLNFKKSLKTSLLWREFKVLHPRIARVTNGSGFAGRHGGIPPRWGLSLRACFYVFKAILRLRVLARSVRGYAGL